MFAHSSPLESAEFLLDGRALITRTRDRKAYFWLRGSGKAVLLGPDDGRITVLKTFNHGAIILYADRIVCWRIDESGNPSLGGTFSDPSIPAIAGADVSQDGERVLAWSPQGDVVAWPLNNPGSPLRAHLGQRLVLPLRWNSRLTRALSLTLSGKLRYWDFQDFEHPRVILERDDKPEHFELSASGNLAILTTKQPGRTGQQSADICRVVYLDHEHQVVDLLFNAQDDWLDGCFSASDDGSVLITSGQGRAWLFELSRPATHQELHDDTGFAHQGMMTRPVFSADCTKIVTFGSIDARVKIWSLREGTVDVLEGHGAAILAGAMSPDMSLVVSASEDKSARVWRTDWHDLLKYLRARTTANLTIQQRMKFLGEAEGEAHSRHLRDESRFNRNGGQ